MIEDQALKKRTVKGRRIIASAIDLFQQTHDVKKVSIEDIASKAQVSPTTVYNQFGTRDELVLEAAKGLIQDILAYSRKVLRSEMPFGTKMTTIVSGKLDLASRASSEVISKLMSQDRDIAPYLEKLFTSEVRQLWLEMLDEGKSEGFIDETIDPEAFFIYMDVVKSGFAAHAELFKDWQSNLGIIEKLTRLVFYGFLKKDIDLFGKKEHA